VLYTGPAPAESADQLRPSQDTFLDVGHLTVGSWVPIRDLRRTQDAAM